MAIGGRLGVDVERRHHADPMVAWFAESSGRFLCEVDPDRVEGVVESFTSAGDIAVVLGAVTDRPSIELDDWHVELADARAAFSGASDR